MSGELRTGTKEKNCGECRHMFFLFYPKVYLGKTRANGWCKSRVGGKTLYTCNYLVCDNFTPFFKED